MTLLITLKRAQSLPLFFVDLGEFLVMQEPGLAALYEKFCEEWGHGTGRAILGLIGLAIAVLCLGVIGNAALWFYNFVHGIIYNEGQKTVLGETVFVIAIVLCSAAVVSHFSTRIIHGPLNKIYDDIYDIRDGYVELAEKAKAAGAEASELKKLLLRASEEGRLEEFLEEQKEANKSQKT